MPVSDVRVKVVPVTLDKERTLKYDLNAFAEIEDRFGTLQKAFEELEKRKLKAVRAILWAGLLHEDPKLTEQQVGAMLSFADLASILPDVMKAIMAALPDVTEDDTEKRVSQSTPQDKGWNWPWLKYLGTVILRKSERAFWRSTPRELDALWQAHLEHRELLGPSCPWFSGGAKRKQQPQLSFIDEVWPL
ncbi:hypothetical protein GCM10025857_34260 [Alicyclobacillus contaminans]|nr:hypothetical protein GCM10025857_34260 [Alicyclobacillus contaminans]